MFKLLSKESNIFSIPIFLVLLVVIVILFNIFNFNTLSIISAIITFLGISLGYFLFNAIDLNHNENLPYFVYTFLVIGLYPGHLDIGIATALLTNSFVLLILSNDNNKLKGDIYVLVGSILSIGFLFLPTTYPLIIFVFIHILTTSDRIGLNLTRLVLGMILPLIMYFSVMYFFDYRSWDLNYLPLVEPKFMTDFYPIFYLLPIVFLLIIGIMKHFSRLSKETPTERYKYSFVLFFTLIQILIIFLYMGDFREYLLLLAFPVSILLSRMLKLLPKYWMQECGLWLIFISVLTYKLADYINLNFLNNLSL